MTEDLNTLREALEPFARLFQSLQLKHKGPLPGSFDATVKTDDARKAAYAFSRLEAAAVPEQVTRDAIAAQQAAYERARDCAMPELSREDVVRLAGEAGFGVGHAEAAITLFQRFASLVRSVPVGEVKPVAAQHVPSRGLCAVCTLGIGGKCYCGPEPLPDEFWNLVDALRCQRTGDPIDSARVALEEYVGDLIYIATPPSPPEGWRMVPVEATEAILRPFYQCPPEELPLAWQAALLIAGKQAARPAAPQPGGKANQDHQRQEAA